FEEQLKELAELVRKSQPNASEEAIVEAQCNRIEREVEDWDTLWNKATSQEWRSPSELISALVSTNDHFKRKKERGLQRKEVSGSHNRHENYFGKQYNEKNKVRNVPSCFECGEQGHKRYECSKKGKEEPCIQSKLCEVKKVEEEPKLNYVEPIDLDERMKLILMNRIKVDEIGEDVTLPVLIKSEKELNNNYISILALIDGGANKTSVTYNLAEAMGWKVDDLDEVKVGLAGNIEGTFKKGHQVKLMPIQGGFDVDLRVCVETTRRKDERYGITLGTDFLDMKGVAVHHGQNKMTIGGRLYHGASYNDWNRLKTMCERKKSRESMITTRPTLSCDDVKPYVVQVPKFQFNQRKIPKPAPFDKYSVKHWGEISEKIKEIPEDGDGISVKNDYALKRQSKKGKTRRVYYKRLETFQEIPTFFMKFRTRQKVKMKETVINQIKFETSQIYAITEVKSPYVNLKVGKNKDKPLKRHAKEIVGFG
uniref:CCHC-type domain-containing protein n=1 Tax=Strongyloides papillosus TaxID=174720 RepID=A0A0N5BJH0_STREA